MDEKDDVITAKGEIHPIHIVVLSIDLAESSNAKVVLRAVVKSAILMRQLLSELWRQHYPMSLDHFDELGPRFRK